MTRLLSLVTLGFALAALSATSLAEQPSDAPRYHLRYQFQPGQLVRYQVTMNDDYHLQLGAASDEPYSHQESTKRYLVKSVQPDGSAVLELAIESVQIEIHQNDETFKFDTREGQESEQPAFLALAGLVGRPHLQLTVSPRGSVSQVKPLVAQDQVSQDPEEAAYDVLLELPEEPLAVGDSWKKDLDTEIQIPNSQLRRPVKIQRRYTLKGVDAHIATISMRTSVLTVIEDPEEEMQLIRRLPAGDIVLDLNRGLLVSKSFSQDNTVTGFQQGPSAMTFKQLHVEKLAGVEQVGSTR